MSAKETANLVAAWILGVLGALSVLSLVITQIVYLILLRDCKMYCKGQCDSEDKLMSPPGKSLVKMS